MPPLPDVEKLCQKSRLPSLSFRATDISSRKPTRFKLECTAEELAALAALVGAEAVRKLRFEGQFIPAGKGDLRLEAELGATVVQPCVATLAPVTTRIDEHVHRVFVADLPTPAGDEVEMPEDDSLEQMPSVIDLVHVLAEALALAMPDYPRAPDASPIEIEVAAPGAEPIRDEKVRPFAGLSGLLDASKGSDEEPG